MRSCVFLMLTVPLFALAVPAACNSIDHEGGFHDGSRRAFVTVADAAVVTIEVGPVDVALLLAAAVVAGLVVNRRWYRLEGVAREWDPIVDFVVPVLLLVGMIFLMSAGGQLAGRWAGLPPASEIAADDAVRAHAIRFGGAYAGALAPVALAWWWLAKRRRAANSVPQRRPLSMVLWGVLGIVLAYPLVAATGIVARIAWTLLSGEGGTDVAHNQLEALIDTTWSPAHLALIALVVVGAPIVEETMYRGLIQKLLFGALASRWVAVLCTSLAFALMHIGAVPADGRFALVALFVFSLALGVLRERTSSLVAPILTHALFNALNVGLAFLQAPAAS